MDIPVDFLLEKLTQLVRYHVDIIGGAKNDLDQLNNELRSLKAVLKDASRKSRKDEVFKEWERQIREAVYDVEDAIDTCITEMAAENTKNVVRRTVGKANRISLAKLVRSLREEKVQLLIQDTTVKFANLVISDMPADTAALATKDIRQKRRQNKIIGVEDETNTLINALNDPSDKLEVISIIGMPGLGKTTVAWKIYQDPRIKFEFSTLIWVNISEDPNIMKVLRTILKKFTSNIPNDISKEELVDMVKAKLEVGKFMIVMDDVWTKDSWDELKSFLPKSNNMGRVLITSREKKVAYHANPMRKPHKLRFLTKDESWELLQYEVYDEINAVHKDLVQAGQVIAKQCDGLPLSIIVIGGILKDKISEVGGVLTSLKDEWEDVSKSIETYLVYGDKTRRLENIINLSYVKLPYEVRDCFLYLGVFPEDVDIPVKKLILLWIAEGFIQEIPKKSVEEVAQENLMELINRNLIMVEKTKPDGEAKICRVHDTIRQFCRTEAKFENLNLFQEISKNQGVFEPALDSIQKYRRLCIHSHVYDFFTKRPKVPKSRTFLCSPQDSINLTTEDIALVTKAFQLIRVLDAEKLRFPKFPTKLLQLIHLRYLTLAFDNDQANTLPEPMSSLWNLQTLIVDIPSKTLEVKVDIWIMRHLRHFKTKTAIVLRGTGKGEGGENLQTLSRLSPESCTNHVFDKAKNLITLGIQGDLSFLLESKCLEKLNRLNKLKLVHQVQQGAADKPLPRLPEQHRFPPNLKILVLANTYLSWEHMSVLARLNFLKVLKLKDNAFTGNSWKVASGEFQNLTMLSIERLNVMFWTASIDSFPKLGFLLLTNCENLNEVPFEAGKNLEMLYMERVTQSAVTSAVKIKKARQAEAANGEEFVLNIAPADNVPAS